MNITEVINALQLIAHEESPSTETGIERIGWKIHPVWGSGELDISIPPINRHALSVALRAVISDLDYDLHKMLEDNGLGVGSYAAAMDKFVAEYNKVVEE